jgi:hypothetical protein
VSELMPHGFCAAGACAEAWDSAMFKGAFMRFLGYLRRTPTLDFARASIYRGFAAANAGIEAPCTQCLRHDDSLTLRYMHSSQLLGARQVIQPRLRARGSSSGDDALRQRLAWALRGSRCRDEPDRSTGAVCIAAVTPRTGYHMKYHLQNISVATQILDWLRFTYVFENWYP